MALAGGCGTAATTADSAGPTWDPSDAVRYLQDPAFRRSELEASLVNPSDGYASVRLEAYGAAWEALPIRNPRTIAVERAGLGADMQAPLPASAEALAISPAARAGDVSALLTLGEAAFASYPVQLLPAPEVALAGAASIARYGFAIDPVSAQVGGLVHAEMVDGSTRVAMTCATCHASVQDGVYVRGLPNANLDVGQLLVDAGGLLPDVARATAAWGPGRLDVSSTDGKEAARIPDLRPVRELGFLQQDATVLQRNIASLALRTETLVITSQGEDVRPPREVALGLAIYVWSLAAALPAPPATSSPGGALLRASCAPCHASPGFTGAPVSIAEAGTDPTLGLSPQRGTGAYRVPSLRGVGSRGPLFHDASAPSLAAFFDPARASASFTGGRGGGPIPGHAWSLGLGAADRALLLTTLGAM